MSLRERLHLSAGSVKTFEHSQEILHRFLRVRTDWEMKKKTKTGRESHADVVGGTAAPRPCFASTREPLSSANVNTSSSVTSAAAAAVAVS